MSDMSAGKLGTIFAGATVSKVTNGSYNVIFPAGSPNADALAPYAEDIKGQYVHADKRRNNATDAQNAALNAA